MCAFIFPGIVTLCHSIILFYAVALYIIFKYTFLVTSQVCGAFIRTNIRLFSARFWERNTIILLSTIIIILLLVITIALYICYILHCLHARHILLQQRTHTQTHSRTNIESLCVHVQSIWFCTNTNQATNLSRQRNIRVSDR